MTKETNKQIIADAPEGATHFDGGFYLKCNEAAIKSSSIWSVMSSWGWDLCGALELNDVIDFRSLADITELVELRKKNAELKREKGNYKGSFEVLSERLERMQNEQSIRDLEQQAKGLEILAESMSFRGHLENVIQISDVLEKADDLRNQVKQLKGGDV